MSSARSVSEQDLQIRLSKAVLKAQNYLLEQQNHEGYWWAELEANVSLTAEYVMLHRILIHSNESNRFTNGKERERQIRQMAGYIVQEQRSHGGWELYYGDGGELSTSIEAYFALILSGYSNDEPAIRRARKFILDHGGLGRARVFTKLHLALFGAYPWEGIPTLPTWFMLLPRWVPFNIYSMASWARSSTVPLLVVLDRKPVYDLGIRVDELFTKGSDVKDQIRLRNNDRTSIGGLFLVIDRLLKICDRAGIVPFRQRGCKAADRGVIERQDAAGDWAGIVPAMLNSILMLHVLGYSTRHPYIKRGLAALDRFCIEADAVKGSRVPQTMRLQPCISPTWDTALGLTALLDSGISPTHAQVRAGSEWLLTQQTFRYGDWAIYNRKGKPAGWAFEFYNDYYPDIDDSAAVIIALLNAKLDDDETKLEACRAATRWIMSMQCRRGGWGAFDLDNTMNWWNRMPYGDLKAMIDPPTADLTGRVLTMLGAWQAKLGEHHYDVKEAKRAVDFLLRLQEPDGAWWGRWGVNYIYGTYLALVGLRSIAPHLPFEMECAPVKKAASWLREVQNIDGGWGETCASYKQPELRGQGPSTPSQTAWALLGLMAAGDFQSNSVKRGVIYLIEKQNIDGSWPEPQFTGTGFPGHFFINYHQYRNHFPLSALGLYQNKWMEDEG
jgi:squalene-hopene/tetraprenyl-beta-curcumene cyclase